MGSRQWLLARANTCLRRQIRRSGFGHAALGGTVVFTDPASRLSVAVTVNELTSDRRVTHDLVRFICEEVAAGTPVDL